MITSGISYILLMVNVHPRVHAGVSPHPPPAHVSVEREAALAVIAGVFILQDVDAKSLVLQCSNCSLSILILALERTTPPSATCRQQRTAYQGYRSPAHRRCHCLELGISHKSNFHFQLMENNPLFHILCCNLLKAGKQEAWPSQREAEGIRLPIWVACYHFRI